MKRNRTFIRTSLEARVLLTLVLCLSLVGCPTHSAISTIGDAQMQHHNASASYESYINSITALHDSKRITDAEYNDAVKVEGDVYAGLMSSGVALMKWQIAIGQKAKPGDVQYIDPVAAQQDFEAKTVKLNDAMWRLEKAAQGAH